MNAGSPTIAYFGMKEQPGPPFQPTSADNGLSVDTVSGRIVLGNDTGQVQAALLSNREIPTNGFNLLFSSGVAGSVRINPSSVIVTSSNQIAFRCTNGVITGDMAIDLNGLGMGLFVASLSRGIFLWNNPNPLQGSVRIGIFPSNVSQDNGATCQVAGSVTGDAFVSPQAVSPVSVNVNNDKGKVFTNEGAGAVIQFNLPTATVSAVGNAGMQVTFYVQNANGIIIKAAAGDTVRIGAVVSPAAGTVSNAVVGSSVTLQCINAAEWVAIAAIGIWVTP
jgi:hypothetical protein